MSLKFYRARRRWFIRELKNTRLGRRPPYRWERQAMFEMCRRDLVELRAAYHA